MNDIGAPGVRWTGIAHGTSISVTSSESNEDIITPETFK